MKKYLLLGMIFLIVFAFLTGCTKEKDEQKSIEEKDGQRIFSSLEECGGFESCVSEQKNRRLTGNYIKAGKVKEGEYFESIFVPLAEVCEEGLTAVKDTRPTDEGCDDCDCYPMPHVCTKCGNGNCGITENVCNCPEDCK